MVRNIIFGNGATKGKMIKAPDDTGHEKEGFVRFDEELDGVMQDKKQGEFSSLSILGGRRTDVLVIFGMIVLVSGLLGVVYVLYKFIKEDQYRWKQMSAEIVKHRAQFDQLSNQMKQVVEEMKSTDQEWTEEIRKFIATKQAQSQSPTTTVQQSSRPRSKASPMPSIVLESGVAHLAPSIMTENDMDQVLAEELQELQTVEKKKVKSPRQEEGRIVEDDLDA